MRHDDGSVLRLSLRAASPLAHIAARVSESRAADAGPFVLRSPFPRREYASEADLATTVREAGLVPRGSLLVLAERDRGVVRHAPARGRGAGGGSMQAEMASMLQAMAEMPNGAIEPPGPLNGNAALLAGLDEDANYEELTQLGEALGGEVARGLTPSALASLSLRTLDESPAEETRCCIDKYGDCMAHII